jgi:pantoate--beta-alanine ligase
MHTIHIPHEMQSACREARREGKSIGLVPTMGALHEGHLSLVRAARAQSDFVAVSIFVNPLQFGPNEDFAAYPRTLEADCALLLNEGVDLVFAPSPELMTPPEATTYIEVGGLSNKLDGGSRPGHFRGVATIVGKLFEIVRPELAFFGQKDAAQVAVLRKMVRDLNMDVQIVVCPIVREKDGLALSSRNHYLSAAERKQALCLHESLKKIQALAEAGERSAAKLLEAGKAVIAAEAGAKLDYYTAVDPLTLEAVETAGPGTLIAVAAWFGSTRLIDNLLLPKAK